ncbi:MAG TPA: valine--pyruvate transaminase [Hyphomicrobiales bacterium]|nr:valine--pyruvate transaminase [Hyphomicrobiales bacterium]
MQLSHFGTKFSGPSGIVTLMDDLGNALRDNPGIIMMGGGNPARIPAVLDCYRRHLRALVDDEEASFALLGRYQGPLGDYDVRTLLADTLRQRYGWELTAENVALTNGGQSAFGLLANMLTGEGGGGMRRLLFPLAPEYLGYADTALDPRAFVAAQPAIELLPAQQFKYRVDFATLPFDANVAALCVSRPTNPSGNVISIGELDQLDALARARGIPLIVDAAYGAPFPGILFEDDTAYWNDNVILLLSLSKLGLPGARAGFMIASPGRVAAFARANTIFNLASGNLGPALAQRLLAHDELLPLCRQHIQPWYQARLETALACVAREFTGIDYRLHRPEGAFFLWLWLPALPIASAALYERLKAAGVLVIPGDSAFFGLAQEWPHSRQCLRLSFALPDAQLVEGLRRIAAVLKTL